MRTCRHGLGRALLRRSLPTHSHHDTSSAAPRLASSIRSRRQSSATPTPASHDIAVLGGGISGLAAAYYLLRQLPRAKLTIYEAADRVGGWLSSKRVPVQHGSILFEAGPRTLRPAANGVLTSQLLQELDLARDTIFTQRTSPAARNRYVYYPDHLVRMPHPSFGLADNLWNVWSEPVFQTALWSAATEIWKDAPDPRPQDESVGSFFSRRFSKTMVDRILSAVIHGIYAGDVWQLSAKSLFPGPWRDEGQAGSVFLGMLKSRADGLEMSKREADFLQDMKSYAWDPLLRATLRDNSVFTFKDGLSMLSDRLASKLFASGRVTFSTSTAVESLVQAEGNTGIKVQVAGSQKPNVHTHVVSSLLPHNLNQIAGPRSSSSPGSSVLIPSISNVSVMTVNLYFRTSNLHEPGFGYLIPQATPFEQNPERALGVVFDTAYSPSPSDLDPSNWHDLDVEQLKAAREQGRLINVNDFGWYNMPEKPVIQDEVQVRGTKVTVMLGGHWWNDWPAYPDEKEGLALARAVLERHMGIKEEPEVWQVNLQKNCIPQYTVGHEARLKEAHDNIWREYKGRLKVVGNWMSGVGVNDCLRSGYEVAKNFDRDGTGLEQVGDTTIVRVRPLRKGERAEEE